MYKKLFTFLIIALVFLVIPKTALAFGITPAEIYIQNIKPGGHYEKEITLTRPVSEDTEKLTVNLEPSLDEMNGWFKYDPGNEFDFPAGKNTTTFKVVVDVPVDAAIKNYKGQITAKGIPTEKAKEGVTIVKGAVLGVNITTSNTDTLGLKVLDMSAPDVNSGDPVRLFLNIQNLGNVAIAPDKVNLDIMDLFEKPQENLSTSTLQKIDPFSTKQIQASFNSDLDKGQYRVDASVIFQGKEVARKKMVLTVNAKPAKPEEKAVPSQPVYQVAQGGGQLGFILALLGVLLIVFVTLLFFRPLEENNSRFERKVIRFLKKNKIIVLFLLVVGVVLLAAGVYKYLLATFPIQTRKTVGNSITNSGLISPTKVPEAATDNKKVSTKSSDVKGTSVEAELAQPLTVVNKPGAPGHYPIFSKPSFDAQIIYEAQDGETFNVARQYGEWYNVILSDGTTGWLHRTSIKSTNR